MPADYPRTLYHGTENRFLVVKSAEEESSAVDLGFQRDKPVLTEAPATIDESLPFAQVLLARVNDLNARVTALEARRGPGRPPKG